MVKVAAAASARLALRRPFSDVRVADEDVVLAVPVMASAATSIAGAERLRRGTKTLRAATGARRRTHAERQAGDAVNRLVRTLMAPSLSMSMPTFTVPSMVDVVDWRSWPARRRPTPIGRVRRRRMRMPEIMITQAAVAGERDPPGGWPAARPA